MEGIYDIFILINLEMIEPGRVIPIDTADDENTCLILCADGGNRLSGNSVPFIGCRVDDLV